VTVSREPYHAHAFIAGKPRAEIRSAVSPAEVPRYDATFEPSRPPPAPQRRLAPR